MARSLKRRRTILIALGLACALAGIVAVLVDGSGNRDDRNDRLARLRDIDASELVVRLPDNPSLDRVTASQMDEARSVEAINQAMRDRDELVVLRSRQATGGGRPVWHYALWAAVLGGGGTAIYLAVKHARASS